MDNVQKVSIVDEIPIEWVIKPIRDIATIRSGTTPSRNDFTFWNSGTIPWVKTGEIDYCIIKNTEEHVTEKAIHETSLQLYPAGTLLLAMYGQGVTRGKVAILGIDATVNQACAAILLNNSNEVNTEYLFFHLTHAYERLRSVSHGTQQLNLNSRIIADFPLILPPLAEQRLIAAVLNTIQDAIAAQEDVIAAARAFKRSLMQRLFTYGPGREPAITKETEIGEIPSHWEVIRLGDAITLQRGYDLPKQDRKEGSYPIISSSGVTGCHIEAKSKGPGVVTGRYGTIGDVYYIESDFWPLNTTLFVKEFNGNNPRFMAYFLGMLDLASLNDKTSIPGINRNHVHEIQVGLPPIEEQKEIASILVVCDDKISAEEDRKAALQSFFQSTLQQLMTGQVRLLSDELPSI